MCVLACIGTVLSLISPCSKSTADFGRTIMFVTLLLVTLFFPSSSSPPWFFFCASSSSSARVFVAYNLRPLGCCCCCCCCRRSFPNALSCDDVNDDDGERKNLNLLSLTSNVCAAIDDDDAPGSLLPLLLPLLLHALVVVVLLKRALRVLLALALLSERRSRFKSVRLILFSFGGSLFFFNFVIFKN